MQKFNELGVAQWYKTKGGLEQDIGAGVALDSQNNVYVAGSSDSSDFPTTTEAYDTTQHGGIDAIIFKLDGDLQNLLASSFFGGVDYERGTYLAVDNHGDIYLTGLTESSDFPIYGCLNHQTLMLFPPIFIMDR